MYLHMDALLALDDPLKLRRWFAAVRSGDADWYLSLPLSCPTKASRTASSKCGDVKTWEQYTAGWLHAATGSLVF